MTTFDERERSFEKKFSIDEDLKFKIAARSSKLLAQWAADKLGLCGPAADAYIREIIHADLVGKRSGVLNKLKQDFQDKGVPISDRELQTIMADLQRSAARGIREANESAG